MSGNFLDGLEHIEHSIGRLATMLELSMVQNETSSVYEECVVVVLRYLVSDYVLTHTLVSPKLSSLIAEPIVFSHWCIQWPAEMEADGVFDGGLFSPRLTPRLSKTVLHKGLCREIWESLFFTSDGERRFVDVTPADLGALFQMLLERRLEWTGAQYVVMQKTGHKRKASGAYYTPEALVDILLESTLTPLMERVGGDSTQQLQKLLALRVCDPACGAGVFLVAAARRIADRIGALQLPDDLPFAEVMAQVVSQCVYGVDINRIAVELCKLTLWMAMADPSYAIRRLDGQIQQGNALLWARTEHLQRGVLADHFELVTGDNRTHRNQIAKRCRKEQKEMVMSDSDHESWSSELQDMWVASLLWPKVSEAMVESAPTTGEFIQAANGSNRSIVSSAVHQVARHHGFFQWNHCFSAVMQQGGFDAVVGNPPYLASRYLSKHHPYLRRAIPKMYGSASGNWDIYIPFTELGFHLLKVDGYQAYVTPNKIIGADYAAALQQQYFFRYSMRSVHDFTRLDLFEGASVAVVIVVNQKRRTTTEHMVEFIRYDSSPKSPSLSRMMSLAQLQRLPKGFISFPVTSSNPELFGWLNSPWRLKDVCEISDGMSTDQAYKIQPMVYSGVLDDWENPKAIKLINTGTIDPFRLLWSRKSLSFLGFKGNFPLINGEQLKTSFSNRYAQANEVTVAIAGLSTRIEAVVLPKGVMSGVATVLLRPKGEVCPFALTALFNTPVYSDLYKGLFGMSGMTADILNYSANPMSNMPIPDPRYLRPATDITEQSSLSALGYQLHTLVQTNESEAITSILKQATKIVKDIMVTYS